MHAEMDGLRILQRIELSDNPCPVVGDHVPLKQVLLNLITNAIEAMDVVTDRPRVLSVTSEIPEAQHILVKVQDSGNGIEPDHMDRIFEALFTTKPNGMGIGLALCRSIVEAHGGRLWASAAIPYGSIFNMVLPKADAANTQLTEPPRASVPDGKGALPEGAE
jgi:signal transduction histidine kinase